MGETGFLYRKGKKIEFSVDIVTIICYYNNCYYINKPS